MPLEFSTCPVCGSRIPSSRVFCSSFCRWKSDYQKRVRPVGEMRGSFAVWSFYKDVIL